MKRLTGPSSTACAMGGKHTRRLMNGEISAGNGKVERLCFRVDEAEVLRGDGVRVEKKGFYVGGSSTSDER